MRLPALAAAALLAAAAACSRPAPAPRKTALQGIVEGIAAEPPCDRQIPLEWSSSWPVPSLQDGRLVYRVFFFGRDGRPPRFVFHDAEGDAAFTPDGRVLSCARRAKPGAPLPYDGRFAGESLDEIDARAARLYAAVEDAAALYAAGRPLDAAQKARVAAFSRDFAGLADPAQAASYRALSPGFWSWVEANGGRAP